MTLPFTTHGKELRDPFLMQDGRRIVKPSEWPLRRNEIAAAIQSAMYGTLPPAPDETRLEITHDGGAKNIPDTVHRIQAKVLPCPGSDFSFSLNLYLPENNNGPLPVILNGDGCWNYATPEVIASILKRGYAFAIFNRCEIVPDIPPKDRGSVFQHLHPGSDFGAIAAWAWGFHRVMDILPQFAADFDTARVACVGHSRGGKASLLAGALDGRIAIVSANNSGAGGAGCEGFRGGDSESLDTMLDGWFPTWFSPALAKYKGRMGELPVDQHFVKALCAPRPLLTTEAMDDIWANPAGTYLTHLAAREVYSFLGAPENTIYVHYREGGHAHTPDDVNRLLDFCDLHFFNKPTPAGFARLPYKNLPVAFTWTSPRPLDEK